MDFDLSAEKAPRFPGLHDHELVPGITWRFYKHWAQGYLAGERREEANGDRSGGVTIIKGIPMTDAPRVVQARIYESGRDWLSAVYSYPYGIGAEDDYFWEIYGTDRMQDPERYKTEAEMERRVIELLG